MNATPQKPEPTPSTYAEAGVDEEREQAAFARVMRPWLARTKVRSDMVTSITGLASGYFATIMHLPPGPAIALTTDGVGTKIMLAEEARRWEPIGIDCVANNVNDLICVGAVPLALLDYIATDRIDEGVLDEVARGLFLGAELAGIAIPGGEIAQIGEMLAKSETGAPTLDLVGTAIGAVPVGRTPLDGSNVVPGDVVIGLPSSGLHSNGYSLARHALFKKGGRRLDELMPGSSRRLADALHAAHPGLRERGGGAVGGGRHAARHGAHLRRRPAEHHPARRQRVLRARLPAGRAGDLRAHRDRGRGGHGHHVRHVQHGHRVLHRRQPE